MAAALFLTAGTHTRSPARTGVGANVGAGGSEGGGGRTSINPLACVGRRAYGPRGCPAGSKFTAPAVIHTRGPHRGTADSQCDLPTRRTCPRALGLPGGSPRGRILPVRKRLTPALFGPLDTCACEAASGARPPQGARNKGSGDRRHCLRWPETPRAIAPFPRRAGPRRSVTEEVVHAHLEV